MTAHLDLTTAISQIPLRSSDDLPAEHIETVIIGAGQAGLAAGYHLAARERPFTILESSARVGDIWRNRFDTLRLYSPAQYDGLPGMPFPAERWTYPTKDQMGDYLESYAERFSLPVRTGVRVEALERADDGFHVRTSAGELRADNVIVASGTWQTPVTPGFAGDLDPSIRQLHSHDYRNPGQLAPGAVLVVGASHSGSDIAYDVARAGHETVLAGRIHGQIPFPIEGRRARVILPVLFRIAKHVLNLRTPIGRKASPKIRGGGGPLLRIKLADLEAAGVVHTAERVVGVRDGRPLLADGRELDVRNVIWCTGFHKDMSWIRMPVTGQDGWPEQRRGVVASSPGLYFVGLPFLQSFASMLVGGVGRDAEYVVKRIAKRA